ncbi:MAG: NACHT domain-containing protein, partial [Chitinophagales bacterium]|nr:NACHT domain-containing protein [Chitinophagales bacterium]
MPAKVSQIIDPLKSRFLLDYLLCLKEHHQYMGHVGTGVDTKVQAADQSTSNRLFVLPNFSDDYIDPGTSISSWQKQKGVYDLSDLLNKFKWLFLLGDPGMGKTTLTDRITYVLSDLDKRQAFSNYGELIPFTFTLRALDYSEVNNWEDLLRAYFKQDKFDGFREQLKDENNWEVIQTLFKNGQVLIILDGLDEISDNNLRRILAGVILSGITQYQHNYWWCTSRIVGFNQFEFWGLPPNEGKPVDEAREKKITNFKAGLKIFSKIGGALVPELGLVGTLVDIFSDISLKDGKKPFKEVYLAPFSDKQIAYFTQLWFENYEQRKPLREKKIMRFLEDLNAHPSIQHLARIPNMLSMMALFHNFNKRFPDGRIELYETVVKLYLDKIFTQRDLEKKHTLEIREEMACLRNIAFKMQEMRIENSEVKAVHLTISREEAKKISLERLLQLRQSIPQEELKDILEQYFQSLHQYSAILIPKTNNDYGFLHLSYQEYFAADALQAEMQQVMGWGANPDEQEKFWNKIKTLAQHAAWHETLVLFFEGFILYRSGGIQEANYAFKKIFNWDADKGTIDEGLFLAASKILTNEYVSKNFDNNQRLAILDHIWIKDGQYSFLSTHEILKSWGLKNGHYLELNDDSYLSKDNHFRWVKITTTTNLNHLIKYLDQAVFLKAKQLSWIDPNEIGQLLNLNSLNLDNNQIVDTAPLAKLNNLYSLNLDNNQIVDTAPLAKLNNLKSLNLSNNQI